MTEPARRPWPQFDERLDARRAAAYWHTRLGNGPLAPDEARTFNAWLRADPEHERRFREGQAALRYGMLLKEDPDIRTHIRPTGLQRLRSDLYDLIRAPGRGWRGPAAWIAGGGALAAACAALGIALMAPVGPAPASPDTLQMAVRPAPAHATGKAEIREIELPDGSLLTLGAASAIDLAFTEGERRVILREGEAFFDVRRDEERPFLVQARSTLVRVLGTRFDVNLGSDIVDIAVLDGRVEVIRAAGPDIRDDDIKHVLTAGQRVAAGHAGPVRPVETIDAENVAAWRRGELILIDRPVAEIIADLNRYSEAPIILARPGVADLELTLGIHVDDIPRGVRLLATSLDLTVTEGDDGRIILQ